MPSKKIKTPDSLTEKQKIFCREYSVDVEGNIYSIPRKNSRNQLIGGLYLKPQTSKHGYQTVYLSVQRKRIRLPIHRIVATAFIPNPNNLPEVNHKDLNKKNNSVSNLEWATRQENMEHAFKNLTFNYKTIAKISHMRRLNQSKRVLSPEKQNEILSLKGSVSQAEISRRINVSPQTVMRYLRGGMYE